ncbi:MAG: hypothetical protein NZ522_00285, partial [Chitinophagales bacterium]|nr:hypothetical protein [Chitinophagales bacterium]
MTITEMAAYMQQRLSEIYDKEEASAIVKWALQEALALDALQLQLQKQKLLTEEQERHLAKITERLCRYEPVQYVFQRAYFMGMKLMVTPATLIPRPETEELVQWIVENCGINFDGRILDIGTGSGCIAIALKRALPKA